MESKKLVDIFRELKSGESIVIKAKKATLNQTRQNVQKELGCKFKFETLDEKEIKVRIEKE